MLTFYFCSFLFIHSFRKSKYIYARLDTCSGNRLPFSSSLSAKGLPRFAVGIHDTMLFGDALTVSRHFFLNTQTVLSTRSWKSFLNRFCAALLPFSAAYFAVLACCLLPNAAYRLHVDFFFPLPFAIAHSMARLASLVAASPVPVSAAAGREEAGRKYQRISDIVAKTTCHSKLLGYYGHVSHLEVQAMKTMRLLLMWLASCSHKHINNTLT